MAKPIMIQGTMSSAGKSLTCAALCRIFHQDGYRVAPFKSQNMALNSFITNEGLEMGRAQVMQAEAAGIEPSVLMNPILLKPTSDTGSQVIVLGEVDATLTATDYYEYKRRLRPSVVGAYNKLAAQNDIVVIEGAGSPAEINLNREDFVNMGMAKIADAPVLLVGDIDRGGVFASLYGTVKLLSPEEQARFKGIVINKFRGDIDILKPGLVRLEELLGLPVLGVVPYLDVDVDDEDSLSERLTSSGGVKPLDIAVIRLPRISNFTDFNALSRLEPVGLRYVAAAGELGTPDLVILPGTKNTMGDLRWMRQNGLEAAIKKLSASGTPLIGICGGYQMLGRTLRDPDGVEDGGEMRGMEILDAETIFEAKKVRTRVSGAVHPLTGFFAPLSGAGVTGYEIHMGRTVLGGQASPFSAISGTKSASTKPGGAAPSVKADGAVQGHVFGSYLHGLFDGGFALSLVNLLLKTKGLDEQTAALMPFGAYKERQYDILADAVRKSLDIARIYEIMGIKG